MNRIYAWQLSAHLWLDNNASGMSMNLFLEVVMIFFLIAGPTELKPHSRRTCSRVPRSKHEIKNSDNASDRLSVAFFSVSPWEKTSKTGHDATYHRSFLITLMGSFTVMVMSFFCIFHHIFISLIVQNQFSVLRQSFQALLFSAWQLPILPASGSWQIPLHSPAMPEQVKSICLPSS